MIRRLFHTFLRSFFLQTLWNYERMQNMGFAFSIAPLLKQVYRKPTAYAAALKRHTQFFNTHPYFAPVVMGVVYHKEEVAKESSREDPTITVLKDSMGAAFGAVGDHVIWGTWRPFCALLSILIGLMVAYPAMNGGFQNTLFDPQASQTCAIWWVGGFLCLFNALHLWLRWTGLYKGATQGPRVVAWIQSLELQKWASQIRRLGLLIVAALIVGYLARWRDSQMLVWMFAVLLGAMILRRWRYSGLTIFYLVCGASLVMTRAGIYWP